MIQASHSGTEWSAAFCSVCLSYAPSCWQLSKGSVLSGFSWAFYSYCQFYSETMSFGGNWPTSLFFPNEFSILFLFCCLLLGILYFTVQPLVCYQTGIGFYPNSGLLFCKAELWTGVSVWLIQSWFPMSHGLTTGNASAKLAKLSLARSGDDPARSIWDSHLDSLYVIAGC